MAQTYGGRWRVVGSLGEGGQAHVLKVVDCSDDGGRAYALKRLKNQDSRQRLERFRTELDVLQRLRHPGIISIEDFHIGDDGAYFVTELLPRALASIEEGLINQSLAEKLRLFEDVCSGLAHAHAHGIVHRDIKPENILLTDRGDAVVADFGIAYVEGRQRQTLLDEAVGGRNFIAPELESGRATDVTPEADVYALGKLLYWLLSGGRTFARERHREVGWRLLELLDLEPPERLAIEHLNGMLDKMITAEPAERYDNAAEVLRLLRLKRYLIEGRHPPLSPHVDHICRYCGCGIYRLGVDGDPTAIRNFGLAAVGGAAAWHALVCNNCGHVELFRVERGSWWGPGQRP